MKGIELSRRFYETCGKPMLTESFSELIPLISIGLVGSGSEILGFDDELSQDHDFEPGFCIFLPDESIVDRRQAFLLERAYNKLPREFEGYKRSLLAPGGGSRRGVFRLSEFLSEKLGDESGNPDLYSWLTMEEQYFLEVTGGELWHDGSGVFSEIRERLSFMPETVRLKKLAGELLTMAQSGAYNYERCMGHGEVLAAHTALTGFVRAAVHAGHLLEGVYMPYYKWQFKSFRKLGDMIPGVTCESMEKTFISLLSEDFTSIEKTMSRIREIQKLFSERLYADGLIDEKEKKNTEETGDLSAAAYAVNDRIKDPSVRNLHILFCEKQV